MNERQQALYDLLMQHSGYMTQERICRLLRDYYPLYIGGNFHDSKARHLLTKDIRAMNSDTSVDKIIISNNRGVKIASKEEFEQYINREFASIFRKLKRTREKARKGGLNGQMRLPITGGGTVEAFADTNRLKEARLRAGLKAVDVVRLLIKTEKGIDVPLLSKMENGHCMPTKTLLLKLAEIYGVEPCDLVGDNFIAEDVTA